jgi:hypothetical protein
VRRILRFLSARVKWGQAFPGSRAGSGRRQLSRIRMLQHIDAGGSQHYHVTIKEGG